MGFNSRIDHIVCIKFSFLYIFKIQYQNFTCFVLCRVLVNVNSMRSFAFLYIFIDYNASSDYAILWGSKTLVFALTFHYRSFKIIGRPIFHEYNTDVGKSSTLCLPIYVLYESLSACLINLVMLN